MSQSPTLTAFIGGAVTLGFLAVGLSFLGFWRRTGDSLFLTFAAAFALLAANQGLVVLLQAPSETLSAVYLLRLAAFVLIIWAVLGKNLPKRG